MIMTRRNAIAIVGAIVGVLALTPLLGTQSRAQAGKLVDVNLAAESELQQLPSMTPTIAKGMVARRPFKTVVELNKFLLDQKMTPAQTKAFYGKAFIPINSSGGEQSKRPAAGLAY